MSAEKNALRQRTEENGRRGHSASRDDDRTVLLCVNVPLKSGGCAPSIPHPPRDCDRFGRRVMHRPAVQPSALPWPCGLLAAGDRARFARVAVGLRLPHPHLDAAIFSKSALSVLDGILSHPSSLSLSSSSSSSSLLWSGVCVSSDASLSSSWNRVCVCAFGMLQ